MKITCIMYYFVSIFIFFLNFSASAKQIPDNNPTSIKSIRPDVQIIIKSSRPVIPLNDIAGIVAEIKNNSPKDIFFKPRNICMFPPPEINPEGTCWWASINNAKDIVSDREIYFGKKTKEEALNEKWRNLYKESDLVVRLPSGGTATAFWTGLGSQDNIDNIFCNFIRSSVFMPGDYLINVFALYWIDEKDASNQNRNYYIENAEIKISVTTPQYIIMIGALIGGLIAYTILPNVKSCRTGKIRYFLDPLSAALFGVIVTVLLSRVSETQFFIRVTVNDIWGSMAIGFLANAAGFSIINKYLPSGPKKPEDAPKPVEDTSKTVETNSKKSEDAAKPVEDTSKTVKTNSKKPEDAAKPVEDTLVDKTDKTLLKLIQSFLSEIPFIGRSAKKNINS